VEVQVEDRLGGRVSYLAALPGAVATIVGLGGLRVFPGLVDDRDIAGFRDAGADEKVQQADGAAVVDRGGPGGFFEQGRRSGGTGLLGQAAGSPMTGRLDISEWHCRAARASRSSPARHSACQLDRSLVEDVELMTRDGGVAT
jgi:hypothetical protein